MPFVRFSRDKRGYEHTYLVHAAQGRGRSGPARILYWYRTPPGVKVGREPFDQGVRRALEAEYPNLQFDWKRITSTPMPPPEAENWREKRRLMKEMRAARAAEEREAQAGDAEASGGGDEAEPHAAAAIEPAGAGEASIGAGIDLATAQLDGAAEPASSAGPPGEERRHRRRRGGRRRRRGHGTAGDQPDAVALPAEASASEPGSGAGSNAEPDSPDKHWGSDAEPDSPDQD